MTSTLLDERVPIPDRFGEPPIPIPDDFGKLPVSETGPRRQRTTVCALT